MRLDALTLYDFRNYAHLEAQFVPGVNLILGENAQGKTNLLEAVAYLSTGRSFRTARPQELVRFGADFADLSAELFSAGAGALAACPSSAWRWVAFASPSTGIRASLSTC